MMNQNTKSYYIGVKFSSRDFSGSRNFYCFLLEYEFAGNCCWHFGYIIWNFNILTSDQTPDRQPQKSSGTEFRVNQVTFLHFASPYSIRYSKYISECRARNRYRPQKSPSTPEH